MFLTQNEIKARIKKLEKQVKRAEEQGNTASAHHVMLERYRRLIRGGELVESVILETPEPAKRRANYGKSN